MSKLLFKNFCSYMLKNMLIVLLLLTIIIPVCLTFYHRTASFTITSQQEALDSTTELLNSQLKILETMVDRVCAPQSIRSLSLHSDLTSNDYLALKDLHASLSSMCSTNTSLADIIVVFKGSGTAVTGHGVFSDLGYPSGVDSLMNYYSFDSDTFVRQLYACTISPNTYSYWGPMCMTIPMNNCADQIAFACGRRVYPNVYAFSLIGQDSLEKAFQTITGRVDLSTPAGQSLSTLYAAQNGDKVSEEFILDSRKYPLFQTRLYLDIESYQQVLHSSAMTILLFALGVIVSGIVLAAFTSYSSCKPLNQLIDRLKEYQPVTPDHDEAFGYLLSSVESLCDHQQSTQSAMENLRQTMNHNSIDRYLRTPNLSPSDINVPPDIENFPSTYVLAYIVISVAQRIQEEEALRPLTIITGNDLARSLNAIFHQIHYFSFVLIIPADSDRDQQLKLLRDRAALLGETLKLPLSVAVSPVHTGISQLNDAFESARLIMASNGTAPGIYTAGSADALPPLSTHDSRHLLSAIMEGNLTLAEEMLLELINNSLSDVDLKQRYYYARMPLLQAKHQLLPDDPRVPPSYAYCHSPEQLVEQLCAFAAILCEAARERTDAAEPDLTHSPQLAEQVIGYINENFVHDDLSVQTICEDCNVTEKALNEICRTVIGMNVSAYIRRLRMDKASSMLRNTDVKVIEILKLCGYNTPNAFYKAFKQAYGKSPSEYRALFRSTGV